MKRFISLLAFISVVAVSVLATTPAAAVITDPVKVVSDGVGETWKDVSTVPVTTGTAFQVTDFVWPATTPVVPTDAYWIWKTPLAQGAAPAAVVIFKEKFYAPKAGTGTIQITADNKYRLRLNGAEIGRNADWTTLESYPVNVVEGTNLLKVRVRNFPDGTPNPAGLIYRLYVTYPA